MTRKFNNQSTGNKRQNNPSHGSAGQNKNIYKDNKDSKKDNNKKQPQHSKPSFPPPAPVLSTPPPPPAKPISQSAKANLAKLANINKLMTGKPSLSQQKQTIPKQLKPTVFQVQQALQSLKGLQNMVDSYDGLEMDQKQQNKMLDEVEKNDQNLVYGKSQVKRLEIKHK